MSNIHPTAIVSPHARLAPDVVVGPWCMIGDGVTVGSGTQIQHHVTLEGPLVIGERNVLYPGAALGLPPQDRKFTASSPSAGVVIGDDNIFREGVTIHRATGKRPTTVGSRNMLMVNSHLAHDVVIGDECTLANGALVAGHVTLASNVILSGNSAVHQFSRVGRLAMVSGAAAVTQDLPPFCTVYVTRRVGSLNLVGLRRAGLRGSIRALRSAFDILYRQRHSRQVAVDLILKQLGDDPHCREFAEFCAASTRGIGSYTSSLDIADAM